MIAPESSPNAASVNHSLSTSVSAQAQIIPQSTPVSNEIFNKNIGRVSLSGIRTLRTKVENEMANQVQFERIIPTQENILPIWKEMVDIMFSRKAISKNMLMECNFIFSDHKIEVNAPLSVFDYLTAERLYLLDVFKRKYHDEEINVVVTKLIVEEKDLGKQVMSTREVFEAMAKRNPFLQQLKDGLKLEFDY